jgi:hypothetical protein
MDAALTEGRLRPRQRRRIMSYPLVIRLMIAMTLMPDASYCEALCGVAGLLADVPFTREWHVPTGKVVTDWRLPVPPDVTESIFWRAAGPLIGGGEPSAVLLAGMMVLAADGMLVNLADTPTNRALFGPAGTAGDSSPFPQLRIVAVTARAGRAMLGAILGQAGTAEQTLLKRLVRRRPGLFAGRVACFDRNFPGYDLITAILAAGGHVIARVKEGIPLPFDRPDRGWLPDGSHMTWLNAPSGRKADRLPVRAAEHNVIMPAADGTEEASQTCTVITTLLSSLIILAPSLEFCVDPARLAETAFCLRRSWSARWRNLALRLLVESLALYADQELLIERLINNLTLDECGQVISLAEVEILARSCQSG